MPLASGLIGERTQKIKVKERRPIGKKTKKAEKNLEALITAFAADDTVISGGLVVSSFVGVKNSSKAVVAGMSGKNFLTGKDFAPNDETCPWLFGGAASAVAANSAVTRFYMNGKFYSNDAVISGTITAKSGSFGDFKIDGLYLTSSHSEDHGTRLGDGAVVNWNGNSRTTMFAAGATLDGIMPSYPGIASASAQFVAQINGALPNGADVAYYAHFKTASNRKAFALLSNTGDIATVSGDIESVFGVIRGHLRYRTSEVKASFLELGGDIYGKEQLFLMKNTTVANVVLPSAVYADVGETYYFVQCTPSSTSILPKQGTNDRIKNASGAVVSRYAISENQSTAVMWDGEYWRILPF